MTQCCHLFCQPRELQRGKAERNDSFWTDDQAIGKGGPDLGIATQTSGPHIHRLHPGPPHSNGGTISGDLWKTVLQDRDVGGSSPNIDNHAVIVAGEHPSAHGAGGRSGKDRVHRSFHRRPDVHQGAIALEHHRGQAIPAPTLLPGPCRGNR